MLVVREKLLIVVRFCFTFDFSPSNMFGKYFVLMFFSGRRLVLWLKGLQQMLES